jgi:hypothetical protein
LTLRNLEQWLHRHIFKVGWLMTKNYHTTTILYYTFFLPGVLLHEVVYWLAAGVVDVRAERAIQWPEAQEIGELHLNFVRLSKKASPFKVAFISVVPTVAALLVIWWVATNIFDIHSVLEIMDPGTLDAVGAGISRLVSTQDFWLWTYFLFTISNTMMPANFRALQGWRPVIIVVSIVGVVILFTGFADEVGGVLYEPVYDGMNALSALFAVIIVVDLIGVAVLAAIENTIEWITGDSATFKNGKMIAMRRSEVLALKEQERQKVIKQRQQKAARPALSAGGIPSIYKLPLPVPGAPGEIPVTQTPAAIVGTPKPAASLPERPRREEPSMIPGTAEPVKPARVDPVFNPERGSTTPDDDDFPDEDEG